MQPRAEVLALGRGRAASLQQLLGLLQARARIAAGNLQQVLGVAAGVGKRIGLEIERAPDAAVGRRGGRQRVGVRVVL